MESQVWVESGLQLLARLTNRPSLLKIDTAIFPDDFVNNETIEITGNASTGKTLLLLQLLAKTVLPLKNHGCKNAAVVLINTDFHFKVQKLITIMKNIIASDPERICEDDNVIAKSLENFRLINCFSKDQLTLAMHNLENILANDSKIALVAIDSISSFYWEEREYFGIISKSMYVKKLLAKIQKITMQFNLVTIYTKPSHFVSKGITDPIEFVKTPSVEKITRRIKLISNQSLDECYAEIESIDKFVRKSYEITESGILWKDKQSVKKEEDLSGHKMAENYC